MSPDSIYEDVKLLKEAMWGNRENPKEYPGVITELMLTATAQKRTNEILTDLSNSVRWIARLIISGAVLGIIGILIKVASSL